MRFITKPVLCNYYLTYRCNAQCGFCDIWEKPSPYVNEDNVLHNLQDLKKLGVKVIDFTGGEPLLHQKLPLFLSWAKKLGFITTVTTNTLLYPKNAEKLKGLVDMLHFSLDSPDEQEHNRSRGVNCYQHFTQSIQVAKSLNEKPDILFTVHSQNIHQIQEVYEKFALPNDLILILNPIFSYNDIGQELTFDDIQFLKSWRFKKNVYINEAFLMLRQMGGNQINNPVCKAGSSTIVISPENELLLPCYHLAMKNYKIENNLYQLWKSMEIQETIKMEGKLPNCQGCTINCYMQPSFAVEMNSYFWKALPSTLKYTLEKWVY